MDWLFTLMTWVTLPLLAAVVIILLYCIVRYRQRDGHKAAYITGFRTPWGLTVLCGLFLLMELPFDFYQEKIWADARKHRPAKGEAFVVQVFPEQFAWNFRYPGPDGKFGTPDDVASINELHVPVGRPVLTVMRSKDVVHSFFLPHLRVKQDVLPGRTTRAWFEATKTGEFEVGCAELCGLGHYRMRGYLTIEEPKKVVAWLESQRVYGIDESKWGYWTGGTDD
ncbi:MAG: hypothetical protein HYU36_04025 [Planctomycetes bacterium]|nr:hypothetical protein [Planctomycetota bacterium]